MKIQRNFYTELKEDLLECIAECGESLAQRPRPDNTALIEHMFQNERFRLLKKAADGQSMNAAAASAAASSLSIYASGTMYT